MQIPLSYSDVPPLEIAEANFMAVLEPRAIEPSKPTAELVELALDHPIDSPPIEDLVSPTSRVLFLVDDITRKTPAWAVLPVVLRRMASKGIPRENIKILIAAGTHALMTSEEIEKKLGPTIPREHAVIIHHWKDEKNLKPIGTAPDGTPVRVNRLLSESDVVIGIGQIVPHRVQGFTGGASIVQPGVSGREVTGYTHWMSALYSGQEILGIAENPVRQEVERI